MTTQEQIQFITNECIKANPSIADVLLAIDKISSQYSVGADGRFTVLDITKDGTSGLEWVKESNGVLALTWNLLKDSLFSQSPETIEFIFNLLNK